MPRSSIAAVSIAALLALISAGHAWAQEYPTRPVRIVTSPAGGGNDFPARIVARGLTNALGQQFIVDNRPTIVIADVVAKSPPDGYTLLVSGSPHWIGPLIEKVTYDPIRDFAPITLTDRAPVVLVVHPSLPARSVKQLIALAKARPGALNYSTGAPGGSNHLGGVLFNYLAHVNIVRIPYKGSGPALTALMSGEVQVMFPGVGAAAPHVHSGRLRALAVGSAERSAFLPDVPTMAAAGVPGYVSESLHALFAPAGTSGSITARLNQEAVRFLKTNEAKDAMMKGGVEAISSSPEELTNTMRSEMASIGKILKAAGIGSQ
jgi:tripartite-type tricarboxylate transporter receptor subunit TctC